MSEEIWYELHLLGWSFLLGIWFLIVYDGLRLFRQIVPHHTLAVGLEDIGYWVYAAIRLFALLYYENDGNLRAYAVAGVFGGMLLYNLTISLFFRKVLKKIGKYFKMKKERENGKVKESRRRRSVQKQRATENGTAKETEETKKEKETKGQKEQKTQETEGQKEQKAEETKNRKKQKKTKETKKTKEKKIKGNKSGAQTEIRDKRRADGKWEREERGTEMGSGRTASH